MPDTALAGAAQLVGHMPGLQVPFPGARAEGNQSMFPSHIDVPPLSLSLPYPLSKIKNKIVFKKSDTDDTVGLIRIVTFLSYL